MIFAPARSMSENEVASMAENQSQSQESGQSQQQPAQIPPQQVPESAGSAQPVDYGMSDELSLPDPLVLAGIGLLLLAIITFLPAVRDPATWLDRASFTDNPLVQVADGVARFWSSADSAGRYQPMALTSFWLEFRFFHDSLPAAHLINVLLNAAVALLLWTLLRRLNVPGAWFAAAAFAVHPVHTQAIAWISGRSIVLASAFYLSAMLVYLRFLGVDPPAAERTLLTLPQEPERLWGLAFVLFLCAMLSNAAAAITFPIAILILLWWKRDKVTSKEWLGLIPFFFAAVALGVWVAWQQVTALATKALIAAFGFTSPFDAITIGARAIWFYAIKIIDPHPLLFDYPPWTNSLAIDAIAAAALIIALVLLWTLRKRIGRGPMAAVLLFVVSLVPMLGLLDPPAIRYSLVADYRQYLASAALITPIAAIGALLIGQEKWRGKLNPAYCAGAVIAALAVLSLHQGTFYLTNEALWRHTLAYNSRSILADEEYADALVNTEDFDRARSLYEAAQSIAPNDPHAATGLGTVAAAEGYEDQVSGHPDLAATQQTSAIQYFHDAIRLDPDYKPAYVALATLLTLQHDDKGAIDALEQAVRIEPDALLTQLQLGAALRRVGRLDDAAKALTDLLEEAPNVAAIHSELGDVYIEQHNPQGALTEWQQAVQLDPANTTVLLNFGELLDSSGQPELAAKQFQAATLIDPNLLEARLYLAHIYAKLGHRHDAVVQLTRAVEIAPQNPQVQAALAKAQHEETVDGPGTPASSQPATESTSQPSAIGDGLSPNPNAKLPPS
jgi:tetratricopeptide (TPR) repeat protein